MFPLPWKVHVRNLSHAISVIKGSKMHYVSVHKLYETYCIALIWYVHTAVETRVLYCIENHILQSEQK